MTREEFVAMACAVGVRAVENPAQRRQHVEHLKATAELAADALGMMPDGRIDDLRQALDQRTAQLNAAAVRIRELEEQLEAATAPSPPKGKRP